MVVDDDRPHWVLAYVVDVANAAYMEDAVRAEDVENAGNAVSAVDVANIVDAVDAMYGVVMAVAAVAVAGVAEGSTKTQRNRKNPLLRGQNEAGKSWCTHHIQRS